MKAITIQVPDDFKVSEGYEIKIVKKEPIIKTYQDLIDNNIETEGCWINAMGNIEYLPLRCTKSYSRNTAASEKVAKSMRAMAMISQLMPYYGGEITNEEWDSTCPKHVIRKQYDKLYTDSTMYYYHFLAFHTREQRDDFLKYNEQLVKDYLMID